MRTFGCCRSPVRPPPPSHPPDEPFLPRLAPVQATQAVVGLAAYVSSRMSVHEGGREQAVEGGGKKVRGRMGNSERAEGAFPEFRFCVLNADAAELTRRLLRRGGDLSYPVLTTKWFRPFLFGPASHSPTLPA